MYYPEEEIAVDESMMPWQGRVSFKQFIPSKPIRYGIKLYFCCEAKCGYVCRLKVYAGKEGNVAEKQHGENVVRHLVQDFYHKGHTVYMDSFFSSVQLFEDLFENETKACGTLRANRKWIPASLKGAHLKKSEATFRRKENIMIMKYKDKKDVFMLSSKHTQGFGDSGKTDRTGEKVMKPHVVLAYNPNMKGVDQFDQNLSYYRFNRKSDKWWKER